MSNPDNTKFGSDSFMVAVPVAIFFLFITILLFIFQQSIQPFKLALWFGLPIITYLIISFVNMITQYSSCRKIDAGKAFLGGLPSLGTIFIALGIASVSICRIPIASVFAPFLIGNNVDIIKKNTSTVNNTSLKNSNSKECCTQKFILENIENNYPVITGISYGFYVMFAVLFGLTIGNGLSSIC